jgi:hypothetical protein
VRPVGVDELRAATKERLKKTDPYLLYLDHVREKRLRTNKPNWRAIIPSPEALPAGGVGERPKVLVATVAGGYAGSQLESLLAVALQLRGAEVHVLLCDGVMAACQECTLDSYPNEKRFASRGHTRRHCAACFEPADEMYASVGAAVHRYSELITPEEAAEARRVAIDLPLDEIPKHVADGVRVGEHALAGTLRYFGRGTLEETPEAEVILRRYVEAALVTGYVTDRLFGEVDFLAAVFHHGIYVPQGIVGDKARSHGVRVVNWNVAYRKRCFLFSHGDTYHHTLLSEPTGAWENMEWSGRLDKELTDYLATRRSGTRDWISFHRNPEFQGDAVAEEIGIDPSKPCIGMLTNVIWDAQLHYQANAFPSMLDWAETTIDYFAGRPDLELVIRVHPAEVTGVMRSRQPFVEAIRRVFPVLPPNVHIIPPESAISTYEVMERCNAVLIFGTKTGVELAAIGKPVVVAGEAWVRNKGITLDADSKDAYLRLLDSLPLPGPLEPETVERARKYAYHFFFRRMIPLEYATKLIGANDFEWDLRGIDDLAQGASRGLDVICDGILRGTPFIYPAEELDDALALTNRS